MGVCASLTGRGPWSGGCGAGSGPWTACMAPPRLRGSRSILGIMSRSARMIRRRSVVFSTPRRCLPLMALVRSRVRWSASLRRADVAEFCARIFSYQPLFDEGPRGPTYLSVVSWRLLLQCKVKSHGFLGGSFCPSVAEYLVACDFYYFGNGEGPSLVATFTTMNVGTERKVTGVKGFT